MKLALKLKTKNNLLPINYNYPLSSAIYKLLQFGSPKFSEYLHSKGYKVNGKAYKLFSFSLKFSYNKIVNEAFQLSSPNVTLNVTSPIIDDFIKNVISGSLQRGEFELFNKGTFLLFEIEQMEEMPEPELNEIQKFFLYSPLVLSTRQDRNGKSVQHYFEYYDDINDITRVFNNNLINKYKAIYLKDYTGEHLKFNWDTEFIQKQLAKNRSIKRLIKIEKPNLPTINIISNNIPFRLQGDTELMKVGYQCGFGEKNSLGFGMAAKLD
ncbi:MAG: CRISPR-associated endoribonuclease Cas6 [Melioribacteraceae bacterium]|nr:CRISPR-associated endoribonuclease Cas6 [Melioribacteraceae bacterium]